MANHASHAALPYPIKGARYSVLVPYLDADGDPTAPATPDTEISEDNAAATDAAEEVSATSGMDGMGLITFTGAETDCSCLAANFKVASGPKATLLTLFPRVLAEVGTGTLSAGSAGGGTLGTLLAYDVTGCFIKTTGGTGGGGAGGANNQARKIVTYNTGTGAFTVTPNWETTPDATTTYTVLLPEGVTLGMLKALNPTTAGRTLDVTATGAAGIDWANVENPTTALNLSATNIDTDQVVASVSGAVGSVTGAVGSVTGNVGGNVAGSVASVTARVTANTDQLAGQTVTAAAGVTFPSSVASPTNITAGTITTVTNLTNLPSIPADWITAAGIAAGAIDRATFAADTGLQTVRSGTAQAGAAGTITLDASASATNDFYNDCYVYLTGGTGAGQARLISDYTGATKVADVTPNWATAPDNTSTFAILPAGRVDLALWRGELVNLLNGGQITASMDAIAGDPIDIGVGSDVGANFGAMFATNGVTPREYIWASGTRLLTGGTNIQLPANGLANVTAWTVAITGNITGNLSGSVGSVTGAVGSVTGSVGSLAAQAKADVNAEVLDVLNVDTFAEPGQEAPAATTTIRKMLQYLYKAWRNKKTQTATEFKLFADDATTVDQKSTVSDDATTFTSGEIGTGP